MAGPGQAINDRSIDRPSIIHDGHRSHIDLQISREQHLCILIIGPLIFQEDIDALMRAMNPS